MNHYLLDLACRGFSACAQRRLGTSDTSSDRTDAVPHEDPSELPAERPQPNCSSLKFAVATMVGPPPTPIVVTEG
jgi:hypothetical protein